MLTGASPFPGEDESPLVDETALQLQEELDVALLARGPGGAPDTTQRKKDEKKVPAFSFLPPPFFLFLFFFPPFDPLSGSRNNS